MDQYARSVLAPQLSILDGVAQVNIFGGAKYAVRIQADPNALAARQMGINELVNAANLLNTDQPTGTLNGATKMSVIHAEGQLMNADAFRKQIIALSQRCARSPSAMSAGSSTPTRISATPIGVNDRPLNHRHGAAPARIEHHRGRGRNQEGTAAIRSRRCPRRFRWRFFTTAANPSGHRSMTCRMTLLIAGALVVLVIFIFLRRVSATFIPSVALPIALIGTFAGMSLLGFSLDNLSLMALTLSVGFVVDDAIVMLENIVRHVEGGEQPYAGRAEGIGRNRLHDSVHDAVARGGVHSGRVHGQPCGPPAA